MVAKQSVTQTPASSAWPEANPGISLGQNYGPFVITNRQEEALHSRSTTIIAGSDYFDCLHKSMDS